MSQSNDTDAVLTNEECFEQILDYEEDGPHIRLITPDNWLIIISIRTLSDASPVFKAMVETCTNNETTARLELTDEPLERSEFMERLVDFMVGKYQNVDDDQVEIVWLARKYACSEVLAGIELWTYRRLINQRHHCNQYCVQLVLALQAWPLFGQIVSDMDDYDKDHYPRCDLIRIIDPREWSPSDVQDYNRNSAHLVWSMTQAAFETYDFEKRKYNYKRMGRIFSELMNKAEKNTHCYLDEKKLREIAPLPEKEEGNKRRKVDTGRVAGAS